MQKKKTAKTASKKTAKVMGRPVVQFDWNQFDELCKIQCTLVEIAAVLGVSEDTVQRRVKETHGVTFAAHWRKKAALGHVSLRRRQHEEAEKGNSTMLIWLGKQWLGQSEKQEISHQIQPTIIERRDGSGVIELGMAQGIEELREVGESEDNS